MAAVTDGNPGNFEEHVLADLHDIREALGAMAAQVSEMHAELEKFRPLLAMFKPNGASDLQRAGVLRALRKGARGG